MSGHRGAHPADIKLFGEKCLADLQLGVSDLSLLLSRGYAAKASLKLVGDRYRLRERQRLAISRAACSDRQVIIRNSSRIPIDEIKSRDLQLDGFNLIITAEAALSGGVLIVCRDGCIRDLSSVHGSYRAVAETEKAIELISLALLKYGPASGTWLLDKPVSNSGRLAQRIREISAQHGWPWQVEVVMDPDKLLRTSDAVAVTSDSNILDQAACWINLNRLLIDEFVPNACPNVCPNECPNLWMIDLGSNLGRNLE